MPHDKNSGKLIAQNKKAFHDYFIDEVFQVGIELAGTEVKSLRAGKCNLKESFVRVSGNEAFIEGMHISPYEFGNVFNKDPVRRRRLLLHRYEINKLRGKVTQEGFTIVPLRVYFHKSWVKIDIALAKGKKLYDKREAMAKKDVRREAEREFRARVSR
ncbi:MAG: SsrA-binding protein SmpB [Clostridiales bacterium]|jgi:SsrA-binding protein|nr:SsrA-binding protein SmpB [Clostridiales bacterium]